MNESISILDFIIVKTLKTVFITARMNLFRLSNAPVVGRRVFQVCAGVISVPRLGAYLSRAAFPNGFLTGPLNLSQLGNHHFRFLERSVLSK